MGFKLILIVPVVNFQELTELKKKSALLRYRTSKFGKIAKSYTFWGFWNFLFAIWEIPLFLAPDQFQDPIFGQVVASYGFYKRYLGFFEIFIFWPVIAPFWCKKCKKSQKKCYFWLFGPEKWPKISKSKKFPNNVWKTHKMQQLGPIWGPESDLGPKIRDF